MSANTVNTNLNRALLIGGDKVAAYSQFFVLPNKTAAVSAFNLPDCYEVRFQIGFFDDKITEQYCKCFLPPEVAGKYVGSVYLKCPSCNEEDAYVRVTNTNPFIVLDTPQALGNTIRAVLVHSVTGEVFDVSDPVAQEELAKARAYIHFDVDYEAKTEAERGCTEFCPPLGDWNIDCETKGWTEIPNCYPADWFEEIEDCGKVSSIDIASDGVITLDKADKVHLGYLLREPKWWACNAVYDCYGTLLGYGMQNQCNDCPPCVPDKVKATIDYPTPPTPPTPRTLYINAKNEAYNCTSGNKLCDTVASFIGTPENVTIENVGDLGQGLAPIEDAVLAKCGLSNSTGVDDIHIAVDGDTKEFATYDECANNTLPVGMLDNVTRIVYVGCNAQPQIRTCDYTGDVWNNDKLGDDTVFQIYVPEGDANPTYSPLKVSTADEMVEVLNITQKYMYFFMDKLQNDPNAPVYEFATNNEIRDYLNSFGNPYYVELKEWCDTHSIRSKFSTDEAYERAILDFIADTRGILLRPKWKLLVKLRQGEVLPKIEVVKTSRNQVVTATVSGLTATSTIGGMMSSTMNYKDKFCVIGAAGVNHDSIMFGDLNANIGGIPYFVDTTDSVCVFRFVVLEQ